MDISIFNKKDLIDMRARGIPPGEILRQLELFAKGSPFADLLKPCRIGDGIMSLDESGISRLTAVYSKAQASGRTMKFVPASGAATRMFKELSSLNDLHEDINALILRERSKDNDSYKYLLIFIDNLKRFAFYDDLKSVMLRDGIDIDDALKNEKYSQILHYTLGPKGLNLAGLPKGLIPFHKYKDCSRTPFEEHMVEASAYAADRHGRTRCHFTVSAEHERAIKIHVDSVRGRHEKSGINFEIGYSNQKPSTDTIAVNMDNTPFRETDGSLVFRPGGHGALLENLSDLKGDIIFIKNIDNIAPDRLKDASTKYKKALAGLLIEMQERIFGYLTILEKGAPDEALLRQISDFIRDDLSILPPEDIKDQPHVKQMGYFFSTLNRPLRVCGMVRNQSEPGGGPFWVKNSDGSVSIQIIEKSQIDLSSEDQKRILESSTHFNPVDLVCGVRDYRGRPFDLQKYVDPDTFFISIKSKNGKDLKALELPGLWNGAMAYWNTVFVEVPLITFNPVKTILDLLRDEHQPEAE